MREPTEVKAAAALFVTFAALYALSGPGRIDIVDGQLRYDVAKNLLQQGAPVVTDPYLRTLKAPDGKRYAPYGVGASAAALPLVAWGSWTGGEEASRYYFSLTSAFFGAGVVALLFAFYRALAIARRRALFFAAAFGLTSLLWPLSASVFDQAQHAFWVLLSLFLAHRSSVQKRWTLAVVAGLCGGVTLVYQESLAFLLPCLALAVLGTRKEPLRPRVVRYLAFGGASALGLAGAALYTYLRLGVPFSTGYVISAEDSGTIFGNPLLGVSALLLSPGKSVLLYSPPVLLSLLGLPALRRSAFSLFGAVVLTAIVHLLFISSLAFFGGDWAWGPRYLVVTLPLLAIALPAGAERLGAKHTQIVLALGLAVQLLANAQDFQRFFFENALANEFWAKESASYFLPDRSALFARPFEILTTLIDGVPAEAMEFAPNPFPDSRTYCVFGNSPSDRANAPRWMRHFQVFYWPRPWPLWWGHLSPSERPVNWALATGFWVLLLALGAWGLRASAKGEA